MFSCTSCSAFGVLSVILSVILFWCICCCAFSVPAVILLEAPIGLLVVLTDRFWVILLVAEGGAAQEWGVSEPVFLALISLIFAVGSGAFAELTPGVRVNKYAINPINF